MAANVFLSWSGNRSHLMAKALHRFLPDVIQPAIPWLSSQDVQKGKKWESELNSELSVLQFGIICLTPENLEAPWILFEAGSLSKSIDDSYVCPYLLDLAPEQVKLLLGQFQLTRATKDDTLGMVRSLNESLSNYLTDQRLERSFERCWPELEETIKQLVIQGNQSRSMQADRPETRKPEDMFGEILNRLRGLERMQRMGHPDPSPEGLSLGGASGARRIGKSSLISGKDYAALEACSLMTEFVAITKQIEIARREKSLTKDPELEVSLAQKIKQLLSERLSILDSARGYSQPAPRPKTE